MGSDHTDKQPLKTKAITAVIEELNGKPQMWVGTSQCPTKAWNFNVL